MAKPATTPTIPGASAWRAHVRAHAEAMRVRDERIRRAAALGFNGPQIAAEFNMTKERVYQIVGAA